MTKLRKHAIIKQIDGNTNLNLAFSRKNLSKGFFCSGGLIFVIRLRRLLKAVQRCGKIAVLLATVLLMQVFLPTFTVPTSADSSGQMTVIIEKLIEGTPILRWCVSNDVSLEVMDAFSYSLCLSGGDVPVLTDIKLTGDGKLIFDVSLLTETNWYTIIETIDPESIYYGCFVSAEPITIYIGPYGIMSSINQSDLSGEFTIPFDWGESSGHGNETAVATGPRWQRDAILIYEDGQVIAGMKLDGGRQWFCTELFEASMPNGARILSLCADLGAHNVMGSYRFDPGNHDFSEFHMLYFIAALDKIHTSVPGGLESADGRAIAQIFLWNVILTVHGDAGFVDLYWYHVGSGENLSINGNHVAKIEGVAPYVYDESGGLISGSLPGGMTLAQYVFHLYELGYSNFDNINEASWWCSEFGDGWYLPSYAGLVDGLIANMPVSDVGLSANPIIEDYYSNLSDGKDHVIGTVFIEGETYVPYPDTQQRQIIIQIGSGVSINSTLAPGVTPDATLESVEIAVLKEWVGDGNGISVRPEGITVNLLQNGSVIQNRYLESSNWFCEFTGLPYRDALSGEEFTYEITEDPTSGYTMEIARGEDGDIYGGEYDFIIINTLISSNNPGINPDDDSDPSTTTTPPTDSPPPTDTPPADPSQTESPISTSEQPTTFPIQTPANNNHDLPPNPIVPGHALTPDGDGWIEFDEDGVPLGRWAWDNEEELWIFDEFSPLSELPPTGYGAYTGIFIVLFCFSFVVIGILFSIGNSHIQKRPMK